MVALGGACGWELVRAMADAVPVLIPWLLTLPKPAPENEDEATVSPQQMCTMWH